MNQLMVYLGKLQIQSSG